MRFPWSSLSLPLALVISLSACQDTQTRPDDSASTAQANAPQSDEAPSDGMGAKDAPRNLHAELRALFSGFEYVPTQADLHRVGAGEEVVPVLLELYGSEKVSPHQQQHALRALQFYPEHADVARTYEELIRSESASDQDRRVAVRAYGRAYGDQGLELLSYALAHPEYHTRASAIAALELMESPLAIEVLKARAGEEFDAELKAEIERVVATFEKREATR